VSFDSWMLALHVISAFAFVAGMVFFWVLIVAVRRAETPESTLRMGGATKVAGAAVGLGMGGTIAFGIWLAFSVGGYDIWDGWIIAALVLWVVAARLGAMTSASYNRGVERAQELRGAGDTTPDAELLALNRTGAGVVLQALTSVTVLLIIIDMIWKPGA
jgi:uncharacterized membrane protein